MKKRISQTIDLAYDTLDPSILNNQYAEIKNLGYDNLTNLETTDRHVYVIANENTYEECDRSDATQDVIYSAIESTTDSNFPSELTIGTDYSYASKNDYQTPDLGDAEYFCIEPEATYSELAGISSEKVEEEAGPTYQSLLPINTDATYATPVNSGSFTDAGYFYLDTDENMMDHNAGENSAPQSCSADITDVGYFVLKHS